MATLANIKAIKIENTRIELSVNDKKQPVARQYRMITAGKNKGEMKLVQGYYFLTEESRTKWVSDLVSKLNASAAAKAKQEEMRKDAIAKNEHPYKVGMILDSSWGYEQTNVDFYQIIDIKGKKVTLREVKKELVSQTSHDSGRVKPLENDFNGEAFTKIITVKVYDNKVSYRIKGSEVEGTLGIYDQGEKGTYCSWGY